MNESVTKFTEIFCCKNMDEIAKALQSIHGKFLSSKSTAWKSNPKVKITGGYNASGGYEYKVRVSWKTT